MPHEEALWPRVVEQRARFVILDLTGAKMTEPGVAARLLQLAQGAKLLGARVIVTGVRPDAAPGARDREDGYEKPPRAWNAGGRDHLHAETTGRGLRGHDPTLERAVVHALVRSSA